MKASRPNPKHFFINLLIVVLITNSITAQTGKDNPDRLITLFEYKVTQAGLPISNTDPEIMSSIIKWSKRNNALEHCIYWMEYQLQLKPDYLPLKMGLADCYFSKNDWQQLIDTIASDSWSYQEHIRLTYLAYAQRELNDEAWKSTWQQAIESASDHTEKTKSLIEFLAQWKSWDKELESLLWDQVDMNKPLRAVAVNSLVKLYQMQNNPKGLLKINEWLLDQSPENPELINNEVTLHLLTDAPETLPQMYLETLKKDAEKDYKYQLTLCIYYTIIGDKDAFESVYRKIPDAWYDSNGHQAYRSFLKLKNGLPNTITKGDYFQQIEAGDYPAFEASFLEKGYN